MIELDRHIEILLLSNDCVIVPDLGGFMAHHIDARYDESDNMFLPPLRTLGFNPQLKMNDSLLAQSYIEAHDISYPEALRRIENEVDELKQHLENEGRYELNDIGTLSVNDDGNYVFTPCEAGILTPSLYGLSTFEMPLLQQMTKAVKPLSAPVAEAVKAASEEAPVAEKPQQPVEAEKPEEQPRPLEVDDDDEDEGDSAIVIKMSWIRNAVAVAAAVVMFIIMSTPISNSENTAQSISNLNNAFILAKQQPKDTDAKKIVIDTQTGATTPVAKRVANARLDSLRIAEAKAKDAAIAKEVAKAQQTEQAEEKPAKADHYRIVLASHITKKNADAFVEQLHRQGYKDAEVFIRNNVTRVTLGTFPTQGEAYGTLNKIHAQKQFEEAWVMKVKSNS